MDTLLGGGVGFAFVDASLNIPNVQFQLDDSAFAYQGFEGYCSTPKAVFALLRVSLLRNGPDQSMERRHCDRAICDMAHASLEAFNFVDRARFYRL